MFLSFKKLIKICLKKVLTILGITPTEARSFYHNFKLKLAHVISLNFKTYLNQSLKTILLFPKLPWRSNSFLVVRLDSIGDYILFRNYFKELKLSPEFSSLKFYLLGNSKFKDLAENLDSDIFHGFYWVNPNDLRKWSLEKIKLFWWFGFMRFKVVFHPTYSREYLAGDLLISATKAPLRIGVDGDLSNITPEDKIKGDTCYTTLLMSGSKYEFEFNRNRILMQSLLAKDLSNIKLELPNTVKVPIPGKIAIFLGAAHDFRKWNADGFIQLIPLLLSSYSNAKITLLGGVGEQKLALEIKEQLSSVDIADFTGKMSLVETGKEIAKSEILISHDSAGVHLGMATTCKKVICLSGGHHFKRFIPYPTSYKKLHTIYPDSLEKKINSDPAIQRELFFGRQIDSLHTIRPKQIMDVLQEVPEKENSLSY